MRQRLQVYSASGLRMDGRFKLPTRVVTATTLRRGKKKLIGGDYEVLLGFTGVDGALLSSSPCQTRALVRDFRSFGKPYLEELLKTRLEAGYSLRDSIPSPTQRTISGETVEVLALCTVRSGWALKLDQMHVDRGAVRLAPRSRSG